MINRTEVITRNLSTVLAELARQTEVAQHFPPEYLGFAEQMDQLREWLDVNEFGLAYETIMVLLEQRPFRLSGTTVIRLLEVALLMRYKSNLEEDKDFDFTGG